MIQATNPAASAVRVTTPAEAERLVAGILATLGELETILAAETAQIRVGRVRDGLAEEARKSDLAAAYIRSLEAVKANAVALARFAPAALDRLKAAHAGFGRVVAENQLVLATARAVSESLVKGIADELNRTARPQGYAPTRQPPPRPQPGAPLLVSKSL